MNIKSNEIKIELLINPFCLCDRDFRILNEVCNKYNLSLDTYNLWDIDADIDNLPEYIAILIKEWRSYKRACSVYSNVFINGERIPINDWPNVFEIIEKKILSELKTS